MDLIPSLLEAPRETLDTLTLPEPVKIGGAEFPIRLVADEDIKNTGGVPNVERCRSQKFTILCLNGSKTSKLRRRLYFENTTRDGNRQHRAEEVVMLRLGGVASRTYLVAFPAVAYRWVDRERGRLSRLFSRSPTEPDLKLIASSGSPVSLSL